MFAQEMRDRTKAFALRIIRLFRSLPHAEEARIIGKQLLRSGTSVGANYRATCRSRSDAEFIARIAVVIEEADESAYWLELLADAELVPPAKVAELHKEAEELSAIFNAAREKTKARAKVAAQ